jgi:D-glycero-D-manno-heptose 1,7-bisphosphate phosphatase
MCDRFAAENAPLTRVYHCPYHPEGMGPYRRDHPWCKPKPGMFLQAAVDYGLDLRSSAAIGDMDRDMQAAAAAGIGLRLLVSADPPPPGADHRHLRDLSEALAVLRAEATPQ